LVSKLHKIAERLSQPKRQNNKDALDVLRFLRATTTRTLGDRHLLLLADPLAGPATTKAIEILREHFTEPLAIGCQMAAQATAPLEDEEEISRSCAFLAADLSSFLNAAGA